MPPVPSKSSSGGVKGTRLLSVLGRFALPALALATLACDVRPGADQARNAAAADGSSVEARRADSASVATVVEAFKGALQSGDSLGVLAQLSDSVVVYEGGRSESKDAYRSGHLAADMSYLQAVPPEVVSESLVLRGDIALHTSEFRSVGTFRDRAIDRRGAETLVLVREDDVWRIRHIHWSSGG